MFAYIELLISGLNGQHLLADGFVIAWPIPEICVRLRKHIEYEVEKISPESVKFYLINLTTVLEPHFEIKLRSSRLDLGA